ncbi:MAG: SBBP repeat-containing protein, partial [Bacteroidota bacterium]|nr:SBBP repeat-containing protein [Bacteroidota bacterium]
GVGVAELFSIYNTDVFVLKLDNSGNFLWAKAMGGLGSDTGHDISTDGAGNVYTFGVFSESVDFDPGSGTFVLTTSPTSQVDVFITKLDASGNFVWAKSFESPTDDLARSIVINKQTNAIFMTGVLRSTTDFLSGPGVYNLTTTGYDDIFIVRMDFSGNLTWAKQIGGAYSDLSQDISIDNNGNIYMAGWFSGTVDFDPDSGVNSITGPGDFDAFVTKSDSMFNLIWVKAIGGTGYDNALSVDTDTLGNVFFTGEYSVTADFDPNGGSSLHTALGYRDIYITKLDSAGNFVYAKVMGGTNLESYNFVKTDQGGNIFMTGAFLSQECFIGTDTLINASSTGLYYDMFITKIKADSIPSSIGIDEISSESIHVNIFPNPFAYQALIVFEEDQANTLVTITDIMGKTIREMKVTGKTAIITKGDLQAGVYFVSGTDRMQRSMNKKIIIQ